MEFIKEDINKSEAFFNESDKKMSNQYEWSYHATELLKAKIYMWSAKVTTGLPDDDIAGDHIATLTAVDPNNSDLLTAKKALLNLVQTLRIYGLRKGRRIKRSFSLCVLIRMN